VIYVVVAVLVLAVRLPADRATAAALVAGRSGLAYDPSFSALGEFAGRHPEAAFVAADWGMGSQLYCLVNARPATVYEPFWKTGESRGVAALVEQGGQDVLYVVVRRKAPLFRENTAMILEGITTSPAWREVPVDPEVGGYQTMEVRKFVRAQAR
jgi:hypothetical protein